MTMTVSHRKGGVPVLLALVAAGSLVMLIGSVFAGIFLGWPLTIMVFLFFLLSRRAGRSWRQLGGILRQSLARCFPIIAILALVGVMTALWMASGTVGTIVYYSVLFLEPSMVVLWGFIICAAVSYLLGSSIGTLGAIGVPLLVLARAGGVNPALMSGALISGAYFGDKSSPVASSLSLYTTITQTDHYQNSRAMVRSSLMPLFLSGVGFALLSRGNPMRMGETGILAELSSTYSIGVWALAPALVLLTLCLLRVPVRRAMAGAIAAAVAVAVLVQGQPPAGLLKTALWGYALPEGHALAGVVKGGGVLSVLNIFYIVVLSCAAADIAEHGGLLPEGVERFVRGGKGRAGLYLRTLAVTLVSGTWGCGQTAAIVVTSEMMWPIYRERGLSSNELVRDLGNTGYLIFTMVPWATSFINPNIILGITGMAHVPYLLFLYISPLYNLVYCYLAQRRDSARAAAAQQETHKEETS